MPKSSIYQQPLYCLPGLGTDHRIFEQLLPLLPFEDVRFLDYKEEYCRPGKGCDDYLAHLLPQLQSELKAGEQPNFMGLSLGGLLATRLQHHFPDSQLILVSTIKTNDEAPFIFSLGKILPLYWLVPAIFSWEMVPRISYWAGVISDKAGYELYKKMLRTWTPKMLRWARDAAVHWANSAPAGQILHIHGKKDHVFPAKKAQADYWVEDATHYMIVSHAKEVAQHIKAHFG